MPIQTQQLCNVRMGAARTLTECVFHPVSVPRVQNTLTERYLHPVSAPRAQNTLTECVFHPVSALSSPGRQSSRVRIHKKGC